MNRNTPDMECNGKCILALKLAEESQLPNNPFDNRNSMDLSELVFCEDVIQWNEILNLISSWMIYLEAIMAPVSNGYLQILSPPPRAC